MGDREEREAVLRFLLREHEGCVAGADASMALGGQARRSDWISRGAALREAAERIEQGYHRLQTDERELSQDERWEKAARGAACIAVLHQLRQAGPAWDPRLDQAVAGVVGWTVSGDAGWQPRRVYIFDGELKHVNASGELPPFTRSIDAAVSLLPNYCCWRLGTTPTGAFARLGHLHREHVAATPALALCVGILETFHVG